VATFKPKDWQICVNLAHTIAVITDPHESARMISWLVDLMHRRTQQSKEIPHLFVFLDDLLNLLGVAAVDDRLAQLASLGRGAGIHLIIGTQRLGEKGAAGSLVTGNVPARLVFGTADAQDAALFTGRGGSGAERLGLYPGDALLVTDGGTQRLAVGYIKDAHLQTLPQQLDVRRPWLERAVSASHSEVTHTGIPTGTRLQGSNSVLSPTTGPSTIPLMAARGGFAFNGTSEAPPRHPGTQPIKLPDKAPDAEARAYLRRLYEEIGSKNKVLLLAWGGVINESGKTPKSKRWLDEALNEG
ncbi:MAG: hypothetical protein KDE47_20720, partial [Caldilineaceae bacterium]|nr:hypothetical protein [Caldilineaceae bacterium]